MMACWKCEQELPHPQNGCADAVPVKYGASMTVIRDPNNRSRHHRAVCSIEFADGSQTRLLDVTTDTKDALKDALHKAARERQCPYLNTILRDLR